MNKAISELDLASSVNQDDILLISQKTSNGYVSKKIDASTFKGADGLSVYEQWKAEKLSEIKYMGDTLLSVVRDEKNKTDAEIINEFNLTQVFNEWLTKNSNVINQFLTENNYYDSYQEYISNNEYMTFNDFITKNDLTDVFNNWTTVNQTTLQQNFVNSTTLMDVYNQYYQTNVINKFLAQNNLTQLYQNYNIFNEFVTQNNLTEVYQQYMTVNENKTFNDFITENNHTEVYQQFVTENNIAVNNSIFNEFVTNNHLSQTFNDYTTTNNITYQTVAEQVINQYELKTIYQQWVDNRATYLTQNIFIEAIQPKVPRQAPVPKFEDFWICGSLEPDQAGAESLVSLLPVDAVILENPKNNYIHALAFSLGNITLEQPSLSVEIKSPRMFKVKGVQLQPIQSAELKFNTHTTRNGGMTAISEFVGFDDDEFIMIEPFSPIDVDLSSPPPEIGVLITLTAKKRKRIPSDSAVVKLSGWFKITDSLKGSVLIANYYGDVYGQRDVIGVDSFAILSDEMQHGTDYTSDFFYNDYSVVATGYNGQNQHATVHIKNMSDKKRRLTFTPVSWSGMGFDYKSSIDGTIFDMSMNAQIQGNNLVIDLEPNQDIGAY